jgi:hypothetical protein
MVALRKAEQAGVEWAVCGDASFKRAPAETADEPADVEEAVARASSNGSPLVGRAMRAISRLTRT